MRRWFILGLAMIVSGMVAWGFLRYAQRRISFPSLEQLPRATLSRQDTRVVSPSGILVAAVGNYADELSAYLNFEYLRSQPNIDAGNVFLSASELQSGPRYTVRLLLVPDLLKAVPFLAQLRAHNFIESFELEFPESRALSNLRAQTKLFEATYNQPVRRKLESLPPARLQSNIARFLLFKAKTDRRVREKIEPVPSNLTREQARELAADVIAVVQFYQLPLDFFLGIGAMENNYLDVRGDLEHSTWKKRADPGDIVIRRRKHRVLVLNYSIGIWQITRETLRYAQSLYLRDHRDYSQLPERLRPPKNLDFVDIDSHVLTTYAGLLFRNLLDRFGGDVEKAVGAYNGGPNNPNLQYAAGVSMVADYARRVLQVAASINGRSVTKTRLVPLQQSRSRRNN